MTRALALPLLLLLPAACGPQAQSLPQPVGGYRMLVPNHTLQVTTANGVAVHLPAGTTLVGNRRIAGQVAYCGPAYVGALSETLCVTRPQENCLSADGTGPMACFPRFSWDMQDAPQVSADDVVTEQGMGFTE